MKNGLDFSNLSHDPKVKDDYLKDPLVHPHVSIKLGLDMFSIGNWVIENGSKWNRPILLMVGTEDHIVSQDKIHQFVENVPNEYLTFKEFTGLYHEIHNEYENQQVFNFILDWIHSQN
jgi:acylglycerol lipase